MSFYSLIKLKKGISFLEEGGNITVNLDKADLEEKIGDDIAFNKSISEGTYFWVSGGGTYLLNGRYIILVKRKGFARVNPNKYSLFTGRASEIDECVNPQLLVRELFEELILFSKDKPYYPRNEQYQDIIDIAYDDLKQKFNLKGYTPLNLRFETMDDISQSVTLIYLRKKYPFKLTYHINKRNDINILFIFSSDLDVTELIAQDGEYHINDGQFIKHNRDIYLYDLITSKARCISVGKHQLDISIAEHDMTEHLTFIVHLLEQKIAAAKNSWDG